MFFFSVRLFFFISHFRLNPCISYVITLPGPCMVPGHTQTRLTRHTHTNYWITASDDSIYIHIHIYARTHTTIIHAEVLKFSANAEKELSADALKMHRTLYDEKYILSSFFFLSSSLFVRFLLMVVLLLLLRCYWCDWCCARFVSKKFSATLAKEFKTSAHNVQTKCTMKTWSVWQKWWCNTKTTK